MIKFKVYVPENNQAEREIKIKQLLLIVTHFKQMRQYSVYVNYFYSKWVQTGVKLIRNNENYYYNRELLQR